MRTPTLALLGALAACTAAPTDEPADDTAAEPASFTVAFIPDSQKYAESFPGTYTRHIQWLVDHAEEWNLVFVSHVGDIVESEEVSAEWDVAVEAYAPLQAAGIPHGFSVGNHDLTKCDDDLTCRYDAFLPHFGPDVYAEADWYLGASPSGGSSAQLITAEGLELLFLHLPFDPTPDEVSWAQGILDAHPTALAQVTTHRYLFDYRLTDVLPAPLDTFPSGRFNALSYLVTGGPRQGGLTTEELWSTLIAPNDNIWSVSCGHVDAEFKQEAVNDAGLPVHEFLVDFQNMDDGGGGWLRLLTFIPSEGRVEAYTVSTETDEVRENGDGFDHSIDILDQYKDRGLAELEDLGFDLSDAEAKLVELKQEGEFRDLYHWSLYGEGQRDSRFALDVDFDAYTAER